MSSHRAMNQAKPILSSRRILSGLMEVLAWPSWYFLYSALCVDTQRPRAVLSLYLVGTWQLPYLALYATSSFWKCGERGKKQQRSKRSEKLGSQRGNDHVGLNRASYTWTSTYIFLLPARLSLALGPTKANILKTLQSRVIEGRVLSFNTILLLHTLLQWVRWLR